MRVLALAPHITLVGVVLACTRERPTTTAQQADTARPVTDRLQTSSRIRELLQSAPAEIRSGDLRVHVTSELSVLATLDQPPGTVRIEGTIRLLIDVREVPATIQADSVWIIDGDNIVARSLLPTSELARIDSGPWFRHQRFSGEGPAWLDHTDSVDVVIRVTRDGVELGYLAAGRTHINKPRIALEQPQSIPQHCGREGASCFGAFLGSELAVMQGEYYGTEWSPRTVTLDAFPPGRPLKGLDGDGRSISVRLEPIPLEEYGGDSWQGTVSRFDSTSSTWVSVSEPTCLDSLAGFTQVDMATGAVVERECSDTSSLYFNGYSDAILFWTGPASLRAVAPTPVVLEPATLATLERRGRELWSAALTELRESERPTSMRFGVRRNEAIAGVIVSWWQVILDRNGDGREDPRGSLFFIYSDAEHRILHASFGHPEWGPRSNLVEVGPYIYFRIDGNPTVFCLTEYGGAWWSFGAAVFDVAAARMVAVSR